MPRPQCGGRAAGDTAVGFAGDQAQLDRITAGDEHASTVPAPTSRASLSSLPSCCRNKLASCTTSFLRPWCSVSSSTPITRGTRLMPTAYGWRHARLALRFMSNAPAANTNLDAAFGGFANMMCGRSSSLAIRPSRGSPRDSLRLASAHEYCASAHGSFSHIPAVAQCSDSTGVAGRVDRLVG
jgi:hypothetical protein